MDLISHFQIIARSNRIANERLFEQCAQLDDSEYRKARAGSFGSIHALLNHLLLADRIWLARFQGGGYNTPPLDSVLFDDFPPLKAARIEEDARIEEFFRSSPEEFLRRSFRYGNNRGAEYLETAHVAGLAFF